MMLDIAAACERFTDIIVTDISLIRSSNNIADGLTKQMSQAMLRSLIETGDLHMFPEQWIIRRDAVT